MSIATAHRTGRAAAHGDAGLIAYALSCLVEARYRRI